MVNFLITSGPTREYIDPVRFISNASSGKMGCELASRAKKLGHTVTVISGPVSFALPKDIKLISVTSAEEMLKAVRKTISKADIFISAAAVSDYRPLKFQKHKIKKSKNKLCLEIVKNPDILKTVASENPGKVFVGFCLESKNLINQAIKKLKDKKLDLIIANPVKTIASDKSDVVIISKYMLGKFNNSEIALPSARNDTSLVIARNKVTKQSNLKIKIVLKNKSKTKIAKRIINEALGIFKSSKAC